MEKHSFYDGMFTERDRKRELMICILFFFVEQDLFTYLYFIAHTTKHYYAFFMNFLTY